MCVRDTLYTLLLLSLLFTSVYACNYSPLPSGGIAGIETIVESTATSGANVLICLSAGTYSSSSDNKIDVYRLNSVTFRGAGKYDTVVDVNGQNSFIYSDTAYVDVTIEDMTVQGARAGAVYLGDSAAFSTTNVYYYDNTNIADFYSWGGAIQLQDTTGAYIADCDFEDNSATYGGAILAETGPGTIIGCAFDGNSATYSGHSVYWEGDSLVEDCLFQNGIATYGALIYHYDSDITVRNCAFFDNDSAGLYLSNTYYVTVEGCTFARNTYAGYFTNAYYNTITNNLACENTYTTYCSGGTTNSLCYEGTSDCTAECSSASYCPTEYIGDVPGDWSFTDCDGECACEAGTHDCDDNADCTNAGSTYTCACQSGYYGNGLSCTALVDECSSPSLNDCVGNETCVDTQASYVCDVDECALGLHSCHAQATCTNYPANGLNGYNCSCNEPDWGGDGFDCRQGCNRTEFDSVADKSECEVCIPPTTTTHNQLQLAVFSLSGSKVICLGEGVYTGWEALAETSGVDPPSDVTFRGAGRGKTILDLGSNRGFYIDSADVAVTDMTLTNGGGGSSVADGAAIRTLVASRLLLSNLDFTNNNGDLGGALYIQLTDDYVVENCYFEGNTAAYGSGIYIDDGGGTVTRSEFVSNYATTGATLLIQQDTSRHTEFSLLHFMSNQASYYGYAAGIRVLNTDVGGSVAIKDVVIDDTYGYALYFYQAWYGVSVSNTLLRNTYAVSSRSVYSYYSTVAMDDDVVGCSGGLYVYCTSNIGTNAICSMPYYSTCASACGATEFCFAYDFPWETAVDDDCEPCNTVCGGTICGGNTTCAFNSSSTSSVEVCACESGYHGSPNPIAGCVDTNECAGNATHVASLCPVGYWCSNTVGGYDCDDVDECSDGSHNCLAGATCTNTIGSFTCACPLGTSGDAVTVCNDTCEYIGGFEADCEMCLEASSTADSDITTASGTVDVVCLGAGTFTGFDSTGVSITSGAKTFRGRGRGVTVVIGGSTGRAFKATDASITIRKMTIRDTGAIASAVDGVGIHAARSTVSVSRVAFVNVEGGLGACVYATDSTVSIDSCNFDSIHGKRGAAVYTRDSSLALRRSWLWSVVNDLGYGAVAFLDGVGASELTDVSCVLCETSYSGCGGLYVESDGDALALTNVMFEYAYGYAMQFESTTNVSLSNVLAADTDSSIHTNAVATTSSAVAVEDSVLCGLLYSVKCSSPLAGDELCSIPAYSSCSTACASVQFCIPSTLSNATTFGATCSPCYTDCGDASCGLDADCDADNSTCTCPVGFSGDAYEFCDNVDECSAGTHDCPVTLACVDTVGSFVCVDIDECATGAHDCSAFATCNNTVGSFTCSCGPGYTGSGTSCVDACSSSLFNNVQATCTHCLMPSTTTAADVNSIGDSSETICFGEGEYSGFSEPIYVRSNSVYVGAGDSDTVLNCGLGTCFSMELDDTIYIQSMRFTNSPTSTTSGWAIASETTSLYVSGVWVDGQTTGDGAIFVLDSNSNTVSVTDSTFANCVGDYGSALSISDTGDVLVERVTIDNATTDSGAVFLGWVANAKVKTVHFTRNAAVGLYTPGAAVFWYTTTASNNLILTNVLVEESVYASFTFSGGRLWVNNVAVRGTVTGYRAIQSTNTVAQTITDLVLCDNPSLTYGADCSGSDVCDYAQQWAECTDACAESDFCVPTTIEPLANLISTCGYCSISETSELDAGPGATCWWCTGSAWLWTTENTNGGGGGGALVGDEVKSGAGSAILAAVLVPLGLLLCCGFAVGGVSLFMASRTENAEPDMEMYSRPKTTAAPAYDAPPSFHDVARGSESVSLDSVSMSEDDSSSGSNAPPRYGYHAQRAAVPYGAPTAPAY